MGAIHGGGLVTRWMGAIHGGLPVAYRCQGVAHLRGLTLAWPIDGEARGTRRTSPFVNLDLT